MKGYSINKGLLAYVNLSSFEVLVRMLLSFYPLYIIDLY